MCRYSWNDYRDTYVCLDCRESWHGPTVKRSTYGHKEYTGSLHCSRCSEEGINIGKDYRVPRKNRINQWKKLQILIGSGMMFQTCGCNGLGRLPKTYAEAKMSIDS